MQQWTGLLKGLITVNSTSATEQCNLFLTFQTVSYFLNVIECKQNLRFHYANFCAEQFLLLMSRFFLIPLVKLNPTLKRHFFSSLIHSCVFSRHLSSHLPKYNRFRPFESQSTVSITALLIASSQAFHSNCINVDLLLSSLSCLQLLLKYGRITLLPFDLFAHEKTTMNVTA